MPTVPYASQPRVGLAPVPGPRINPGSNVEAFGGGIASEGGTLGDLRPAVGAATRIMEESHRIAYEEHQKAVQTDFTAGASDFVRWRTQARFNPDTGWANKHGKDAFDLPTTVLSESDNVAKVIRAGLGSDEARDYFDKFYATNQQPQINEEVQQHVAKERAAYHKETMNGAIDANHDLAVQSFNDPTVVEPAITAIEAVIRKNGTLEGMPSDWIDHQVAKARSSTRLGVLQQMVDSRDDIGSRAYLDQHKAEFVGPDLVKADNLVKHGSIEGEAIRQSDAIVRSAKDEGAAFEQAATIADPQVREKAEQRISLYYNRQAAAKRQTQDDAFQHGYQMLRASGWDLTKVPLSVRNQMGAMHEENLVRASEHQQKLARDGPPGDPEQYQEIINQAYMDQDGFAHRNLLDVQGISPKQLDHLQTLQRSIGAKVQRDLVAGMKATEKAGVPPADTPASALGTDTALEDAMKRGTPPKEATPSMLNDVARSGGGGSKYSQLLRDSGFAIPRNYPPLAPTSPEKPKPATRKITFNRDASGRVTDSTVTIIKPE